MNNTLPVGHRDPRTEMVPVRYLQLAAELVMAQQDRKYWADVPVPAAPSNRIAYEELRQAAVFLPLVLVAIAYYFAGFIGAGVACFVALPLMNLLHKSMQKAIARASLAWFDRDRGRYSFTKFMCAEFDLRPEDITIALILKMSRDFMTWVSAAVQVNREDAAREETARKVVARRRWIEEKSAGRRTVQAAAVATAGVVAAADDGTVTDADGVVYVPMTSLDVNPATGLPMLDGVVDVHGNAFGTAIMEDLMRTSNEVYSNGSNMVMPDNTFGVDHGAHTGMNMD